MNIKSSISFQNKNLSCVASMSFASSFSHETISLWKKRKNCHRAVGNLSFVLSKPPGMNTTSTQNSTLEEDCSGALKNAEIAILSAMNSVLALISVVGNALILAAIYKVQSQRTPSNAFVASMGVADFSVGLFMNPLWVAKSVLNIWKSDNHLSTAIEVLTMQTIVATTFSLCAVSVDRYIAVTRMRYIEIMSWKRIRITILLIWTFSMLFASPHYRSPSATKAVAGRYSNHCHSAFNTHLHLLLSYLQSSSISN